VIWILILVEITGGAAVRVGAYETRDACILQSKVMAEEIHQSGPSQWSYPWRGVCVPVERVVP
jgi:hypothetical protein